MKIVDKQMLKTRKKKKTMKFEEKKWKTIKERR